MEARRSNGASVIIYTLYIEDDRYSVPTLLTAELSDDRRALSYVANMLENSDHYRGGEIWDGDRRVGRVERSPASR